MKRLLLFLLISAAAFAQNQAKGNITAGGTTCATTNACVVLSIPGANAGACTVKISGTYSGTIQFEGTADGTTWASALATPLGSTTAVTSTTSTGTWRLNAAGLLGCRARGSTLSSGTAAVVIVSGSGSASSSGAGTVTNASALTANKVMIGGGGNAAAVDSALTTDGAGAVSGAASVTVAAGGNVGSANTGTPKFTFATNSIGANQTINFAAGKGISSSDTGTPSLLFGTNGATFTGTLNATTALSSGTAPTTCGSATGCFGATAAGTAGSQVAGEGYIRLDSGTGTWLLRQSNGAAEVAIATGAASGVSTFVMEQTFSAGGFYVNPAASTVYFLPAVINISAPVTTANASAFFASDALVSGTVVSATLNWYQPTEQVGTSIWTIKLCDFSVNLTCTTTGIVGTIGTINPIAANCASPAAGWCSVTSGAVSWTFTAGHVYGILISVDAGGTATKSEVTKYRATLKLNPTS